jgi:hypothetical protein
VLKQDVPLCQLPVPPPWGAEKDNLMCNGCCVQPICQHDKNLTDFCIDCFKIVSAKDNFQRCVPIGPILGESSEGPSAKDSPGPCDTDPFQCISLHVVTMLI